MRQAIERIVDRISDTPPGRSFTRAVLPMRRLWRSRVSPRIAPDLAYKKVRFGDKTLRILHRPESNSDRMAIQQCFSYHQYDMPVGKQAAIIQRVYNEILRSGRKPLIVDCGANIGVSVNWLAARYPEARIIAIEPAPDNFELLKANASALDAELIQAGIAGSDGVSHLSPLNPKQGMAYHVGEHETGPQIKLVSIGTVLAGKDESQFAPFLLKVDIEGSERSLFTGNFSLFNRFPLIIMEPHDWMFPGEHISQDFFRFHIESNRELCIKEENIGSMLTESPGTA